MPQLSLPSISLAGVVVLSTTLLSTTLLSSQAAAAPAPPPPAPRAMPPAAEAAPAVPPPAKKEPEPSPRPGEAFLGLGFGNAICDREKPDSDCPVDGATAFTLGGGYRVSRSWSLGLELAFWSYKVREQWKGQLEDDATDHEFSSLYFAPYARWHFMNAPESLHAYLQFGVGLGVFTGKAQDAAGGEFEIDITGFAFPVGLGFEWPLGEHFRLGPQALAYLQLTQEACSSTNGAAEDCEDPGADANALPWRVALMGTFTFGKP